MGLQRTIGPNRIPNNQTKRKSEYLPPPPPPPQ